MAGNGTGGAYYHHVLVLPYPSQGHINPMLQFSKRLTSKGLKTTLAAPLSVSNFLGKLSGGGGSVGLESISDGYDDGGFAGAGSVDAYLARFRDEGSRTLADLIERQRNNSSPDGRPIDCVVYDAFLPWALDVAQRFGLATGVFFTQPAGVNLIYYRAHRGLLSLPVAAGDQSVSIPGLPPLELPDMPSFFSVPGSYPAYFEMVLNQFSNSDRADCILMNTFFELESEVIETMSKSLPNPVKAIGPTIPSLYLDKRVENDDDYDVNLFNMDAPSITLNWLSTKPKGSVVYVSFGSMASLGEEQMSELASALKAIAASSFSFLWVVRDSEAEKLPKDFVVEDSQGLVVNWSPQLKVLASEAVGCFLTHFGWNSTTEALCLGVPMVGMPQWTDQPTNAKFVEDAWKVGRRVKVDGNGLAGKEELEGCVMEVMAGERGKIMKENAKRWRDLAKAAVAEGGSSDKSIDEFVSIIKKP